MLQGNGSGPVTWVLTNELMVDSQRKKVFGVKFASTISKTTDQLIGFIFVDDAHLVKANLRLLQTTSKRSQKECRTQ